MKPESPLLGAYSNEQIEAEANLLKPLLVQGFCYSLAWDMSQHKLLASLFPSLNIIGADLSAEVIVAPGKPFHCSLLQAHSFPWARGRFRCEANTSPLSTVGPAPGTAATAPRKGPIVNLQKSNQEKKRYHRQASPHPHVHRELAPRKQNRQKPFPTWDHPAHQKKRRETAKALPAVSHPVRSSCSEALRSGE